jgi:fused signal recognition particle receptor
VEDALKDAITAVLTGPVPISSKQRRAPSRFEPPFFNEFIDKKPKPVVLMFVGINGTGKTTSIAKICFMLQKQGYTCVIGAGDTFRAGAIEQLEKHADKLGVKLIKHQAGSDPASVAFDAIEHARARKKDVVLVDTAGRMQTDTGLMEEMSKISRVAKPDMVIYVGDALAGNDAVNEAMAFNRAVGIDAVILTKVDADAKGGAALSIRYATGAPVIFVGTGQEYKDLEPFGAKWMVDRIFG